MLKRRPGKSGVRHPQWTYSEQFDAVVLHAKQTFADYGGEELKNAVSRRRVVEILRKRGDECKYSVNEEDRIFVAKSNEFIKNHNLHKP